MAASVTTSRRSRSISVVRAQQGIGNAGVLRIDHIEERREPDRLARFDSIDKDKPKLIGLIGGERRGTSPIRPESARLHGHCPKARNSRKACASRGLTSGNSGSLPTSGEIFQDRAHFRPCAPVRHDGDAGNVGEPESLQRTLPSLDRNIRGDADFGEIDRFENRRKPRDPR